MEERPKTVPEIRGLSAVPKERTQKYSPASYSALYGIPLEDAEGICETSGTHRDAERKVYALYSSDSDLKRDALNPELVEQRKVAEIRAQDEKAKAEAKAAREEKRRQARRKKAGRWLSGEEVTA